ncbi:hypothetical protein [Mumia sp. DW29H23]|uniref:hypothetical protein n=1 Tax=Mumia sp. DW29H23 TaxID=3421241 RepID=UPI003D68D63D
MTSETNAFSTLSVRRTDGTRELHPYARILGLRDGFLFLEDGVLTDRSGHGIRTAQVHAILIAEVAAVDVETHVDDDENSETTIGLESAGMLNFDGSVYVR